MSVRATASSRARCTCRVRYSSGGSTRLRLLEPGRRRHEAELILVCHEGYSSSLAAASLSELGHGRVGDLVGGFVAWRASGLETIPPHRHRAGCPAWEGLTGELRPSAFDAFEAAGWAEKDAGAYDMLLGRVTERFAEPLLDAVEAGPGTRLLDLATGPVRRRACC